MTASPPVADGQIAAVRHFNRLYTRRVGLLEEHLHRSAYSLTEARVLYELARGPGLTASDLVRDLGLDPGYLSRLLKKFVAAGLVARRRAADDGRRSVLALTAAGRRAFAPLDRAAREDVAALLAALGEGDRGDLVAAMKTIERMLDPTAGGPVVLRPHRVGDIGWIARRQGLLYHEEYGWDETFEAMIAELLADFVKTFDARRERAWVAERDGEIVGSVFLVRQSMEVAKLRMLYVERAARGLGIGRRLVEACIGFARTHKYRTLTLWTNDVLVPARRLYESVGFELVDEAPHRSFGKDLVGQNWALAL